MTRRETFWSSSRSALALHGDRVGQRSDTLHVNLDHIPFLQIAFGIAGVTDSCGRTCGDDVARFERHSTGAVLDQFGHREEQVAGVRVLHDLAREGGPYVDIREVDSVGRGD